MNNLSDIKSGKNTFWLLLIAISGMLLFLAPRSAVNVDEQLHYPHAKKVVNWYFSLGQDKSCLDTPVTNLKYYGQSVDNFTALINRVFSIENEFLTRHLTGAFFFLLLLIFAGLLAKETFGSYWFSVLSVLLIIAFPRLSGHAFGNLKDIPFATGYLAGFYFMFRYVKTLPKGDWHFALLFAIAAAFTSSVRIGGLILLIYFALVGALFLILKPFVPKQEVSTKPCLVRLLGQLAVVCAIGYFAGLLFWPFALQDVFQNPLESLRLMEHYSVSIRQVFEGKMIWSTQFPPYYILKWLIISTPEVVMLGLIFYLINFVIKKTYKLTEQLLLELFLLFGLLFPIVYVITIDANLYSGLRQMLFVLPVLIIFSSAGFVLIIQKINSKTGKIALLIFFLTLLILPVQHQIRTFPEDYIYFNSISGGNKNAWSNYEYDYYFHGIKRSSDYLKELVKEKNVVVASNSNLSNYFEDSENINFKYCRFLERSEVDWDYAVFGINYLHPDLLKNGKWFSTQTEKVFFHKNNPITVILKRSDKIDFMGHELLKNNNFEGAKEMFIKSVKSDPNNVWNIAQLAKISLLENDLDSFIRYLQKGREIYPDYEPFYLLEAQLLFNQGKIKDADLKLNKLLEINQRYQPALEMRKKVNDILN